MAPCVPTSSESTATRFLRIIGEEDGQLIPKNIQDKLSLVAICYGRFGDRDRFQMVTLLVCRSRMVIVERRTAGRDFAVFSSLLSGSLRVSVGNASH